MQDYKNRERSCPVIMHLLRLWRSSPPSLFLPFLFLLWMTNKRKSSFHLVFNSFKKFERTFHRLEPFILKDCYMKTMQQLFLSRQRIIFCILLKKNRIISFRLVQQRVLPAPPFLLYLPVHRWKLSFLSWWRKSVSFIHVNFNPINSLSLLIGQKRKHNSFWISSSNYWKRINQNKMTLNILWISCNWSTKFINARYNRIDFFSEE